MQGSNANCHAEGAWPLMRVGLPLHWRCVRQILKLARALLVY